VLIDPNGLYDDATLAAYLRPFAWERQATADGVEARIENDEIELAVAIDGLYFKLYMKGENLMSGGLGGLEEMVSAVQRQETLRAFGLSDTDIAALESAVPFGEVVSVGRDISQSFWLAYVILFLLYITTLMYGQNVLVSVITEKSTKAMELLITSAKPNQLMFGKVLGTGCAGLTQFGLMMLVMGVSVRLNLNGWLEMNPMIGAIMTLSLSGGMLVYAVVFFLMGFFTFSFVYAGVGSTVSKMEESGSVSGGPMMLFIGAFIASMIGLSMPGAVWVKVLSYLPFFSPMVMFMRICVTDLPGWEIAIGIALNLLYTLGAGVVAARIYRVGVLMYGKPPKLGQIIGYILHPNGPQAPRVAKL